MADNWVPSRSRPYAYAALVLFALAIGAWHAGTLAWVNDDSFISFRYAQNFVEGKGLVFNPTERAEGYTNFLWTMMMAAGMAAGYDPVPLSETVGIIFHIMTIALCGWFAWRLGAADAPAAAGYAWPVIPMAALALAVHRDFNVFATSGLETAMFTFFVLLGFVLLVRTVQRSGFLAAGFVFALLMMTRPDGLVMLGAAMVYVMLLRTDALRRLLLLLAPVALLYGPYWLWRYSYYGFPFPNTFYAKSIDAANYQIGLQYLWLYVKTYYAIPVGLALALIGSAGPLARFLRDRFPGLLKHGFGAESLRSRTGVAIVLFTGLWMVFVVRIGGDFMFARFLIPITPLFYLGITLLLAYLPGRVATALALSLIAATLLRNDQFDGRGMNGYVADEWKFYPAEVLAENRAKGQTLRRYFDGIPLRVGFSGGECQTVYYADPDLAIECETGLTDTFIAHRPLLSRGRPGHEKFAPLWYLVERNVNFLFMGGLEIPLDSFVSSANFGGVTLPVVVYDNSVMSRFAGDTTVQYADVPALLDTMIAYLANYADDELRAAYLQLRACYFDHNDDRRRQDLLEAELRRRMIPVPPPVAARVPAAWH